MADRDRPAAYAAEAAKHLLNGETASGIRITHLPPAGPLGDRWAITLEYGWDESIVAICDYDHDARGVAAALAHTLGCEVTEWGGA